MSLSIYMESMLPAVEEEMQACVKVGLEIGLEQLYSMLSYHLGWEGDNAGPKAQGKRVRPLLVLLTTAAAGGYWENALPAAAAVELVHNFSLIHDDIQDNSPLRRGRETVWKKWGLAQGINAGDSMFSLAHIALKRLEKLVPPEIALRAYQILPMSCLILTQGQYLDLSYEDRDDLTVDDYWPMIRGKTAALLATCSELGALIAGADTQEQEAYRKFGEYVGLAFQVQDDILGIWGDAAMTGKSTDSDLLAGKKSLPVLYSLNNKGEFAKRWQNGKISAEEVPELAKILEDEGADIYAQEAADSLTKQALEAMEDAKPRGDAKEALFELADMLIQRNA